MINPAFTAKYDYSSFLSVLFAEQMTVIVNEMTV